MSDRERSRPQGRDNEQDEAVEEVEAAESSATEGIDDLLDEIDSVLEENAEEFVRNYVQKGGE
ncbi:MAG: ubiquitin-like protein Pup [Acidimicrobiia bacterium]|nr:ubiquitin-like protein Pup [Acidimicrobiia bacterium]